MRLVTVKEAVYVLQISRTLLWRWIKEDKIKAIKFGVGSDKMLIDLADFLTRNNIEHTNIFKELDVLKLNKKNYKRKEV